MFCFWKSLIKYLLKIPLLQQHFAIFLPSTVVDKLYSAETRFKWLTFCPLCGLCFLKP